MQWVSQNHEIAPEANYLVSTSQRILDAFGSGPKEKDPSFDLEEIRPTLEYLRLFNEHLVDFLTGRMTGSEIIRLGGSELWENWNRNNGTQNFFNEMVVFYVKPLLKDAEVLEIGGGVGGTTLLLKDSLKLTKTFCFSDIKPYFLEAIKKKLPDLPIHTQILDLHNLPQTSQQFDIIYATNALHVANNIVDSLRWIKKHLRPTGTLILGEGSPYSETDPWPLEVMFPLFKGWWNVPKFKYRPYPGWLSPDKWLRMFSLARFASVKLDLLMDEKRYFGGVYIANNC